MSHCKLYVLKLPLRLPKEEYILYKGNPFEPMRSKAVIHIAHQILFSFLTMLMVMVVILDVFMITLQYSINYIRSNPSVPLVLNSGFASNP